MDITTVKQQFPIFSKHPELAYLDSAATALKPASVIAAEMNYYEEYSANIARGIYPMAEQATLAFEGARTKVARFLNAHRPEEIIFTAGTTASLNLAARLLATHINPGDNIVVTALEHHSNLLSWKELSKERGATLRVIPVNEEGLLDTESASQLIDNQTKIVAFSAVSNVVGVINPVQEIIASVKKINSDVVTIVDAAQAVGHLPVDVRAWDADFVAFSGHKIYGPTGIGVLYGKFALLETLRPVAFGGGMVLDACAKETLYKEVPARFEAGTPNIAGIIGLGAAIDFIEDIGVKAIHTHEQTLITYALKRLKTEFGHDLTIIGKSDILQKSSIISFTLTGVHPHDVAQLLGEQSICVRAGLQCAAPLHESLNLSATTRISLALYNTEDDIEKLIVALKKIRTTFSL